MVLTGRLWCHFSDSGQRYSSQLTVANLKTGAEQMRLHRMAVAIVTVSKAVIMTVLTMTLTEVMC